MTTQASDDVTMARLEDQLEWYDRNSTRAQKRFKALKAATIIFAASIPVTAAFNAESYVAAVIAFAIVVVEGVLQLFQYERLWITFRSTAEMLKHEKYLYLAQAGPYRGADDAKRLLAERIEELIAQEHARWVAVREKKDDAPPKDGAP